MRKQRIICTISAPLSGGFAMDHMDRPINLRIGKQTKQRTVTLKNEYYGRKQYTSH